ncbi:hypothetical protein HD806DRAFT_514530 [Xylariaceae sp. AK1471]|nr:hypothetical protein HD806DRAFT_514530 [Xylariaceae sp. AK1471]
MSVPIPERFGSRTEDAAQQQDDDDDDNVSITSTNPEDGDTEKEWYVDDVLAERSHPDIPSAMQYLIKWENFALEDCTWEPIENLGDGLLIQWEENKKEINAGTRQPFDLGTYDAALAARTSRHMRRNAKRKRLGLSLTPPFPFGYTDDTPVASPVDEDSFESDDEAQEMDEVNPAIIPAATKSKATATSKTSAPASATAGSTGQRVVKQKTFGEIPSQAPPKGPSTSQMPERGRGQQPSLSLAKTSVKTPASGLSSSTTARPIRKGSGGTMTGYQGTARRSSIFRSTTAKASAQSTSNRPLATATGSSDPKSASANNSTGKRLTATRTRQLPVSSAQNIFAGGKQRKKRANLGDVMADPTKTPKAFSNMRLLNIAKKRGIEKGDVAGALSSIPSKFILGNDQTNTESKRPDPISPAITGSPQANQETSSASSVPVATVSKPQTSTEYAEQGVAEVVPTLKRKKSVRFTGEEDNELTGAIDDLFDGPPDENPSLEDPDAINGVPAPSRTLPLAAYQDRGQIQTIQKFAKFGHTEAVKVNFSGITRHTATWLSAFKTQKIIDLTCTCSSFHFQTQQNQLIGERVSAGAVEPASEEHTLALKNVATSLQQVSMGLHLVERDFAILVYPVHCSDWEWVDSDVKKPKSEALLRHVIFRSAIPPRAYPSEFNEEPKAFNMLICPNGSNEPKEIEKLTKLDFKNLGPQDIKLKDKQVYMLLIPSKAKQLLGIIMAWLRLHQPGRPIFTVEQPNSWRLFHEAVEAGAGGTIISHCEFTRWKLEKIRGVWRMLETQKYTFWTLDTGESDPPQYPSNFDAKSVPGTLRLTRLFPFGRAFLITPSFAISEPAKLCAFLEWFKRYAANSSHRIVTCHMFPRFLWNIAQEKDYERHELISTNPGNTHVFAYLEESGRTLEDIKHHFRAYNLLQEIMDSFGDEETSDDIRKIHWLNEFIDDSDEQSLVNEFCWWSQMNMDRFRRFYVLGSDPSKIKRAYRYVDIPRYSSTECSDPDIAGILASREQVAVKLQKEADENGTEVNIAWGTGGVVENFRPRVVGEWRNSICETPFSFPGALFRTDDIWELQNWIDKHRSRTATNWSKLHTKPVAWKDWDMAVQFADGDEHSRKYDTFSSWFNAAPMFTQKRNTWYGLFYTITEEWDEYMPKRKYERHPWIAIYRPKHPQRLAFEPNFTQIELFIWDVALDKRRKSGNCLLDMQRQLVDFVYSAAGEKFPGCSLSDVWYGNDTELRRGPNDNHLDFTCRRIVEMFDNARYVLPNREDHLREKWAAVDERVWKEGMSYRTIKMKPWRKPSELAPERIRQTEKDLLKPEKMVYHPRNRETRGRGTKCLNDLYEACYKARLEDPEVPNFKYKYRPTLEWWAEQVEEGRDYGYVCVDVAGRIIDKLPRGE